MNRRDFMASVPVALSVPSILASAKPSINTASPKGELLKLRGGEMNLEISSLNGPIKPGQSLRIEMVKHHFSFGADNAYIDGHYRSEGADSRSVEWLKMQHLKLFNSINLTCYWTEKWQNSMNMIEEFQGEERWGSFIHSLDWAKAHNLNVKGHPVFWPTPKAIPDWLKRYDNATRWKMIETRVRKTVARFKASVPMWDVVNEMLWEPAPINLDKRNWPHIEPIEVLADYIAPILAWCREENPGGVFLLNDYGTDGLEKPNLKDNAGNPVTDATQRKRYAALIKALKERGQAPSAIGLQSHSGPCHTAESIKAIYDELAATGLPLHITEFWINNDQLTDAFMKDQGLPPLGKATVTDLENARAQYAKMVMTEAFKHPKVDAFYFWGFWKRAFAKEEKWFTEPLPVYNTVYKLIKEDWWSSEDFKLNASGTLKWTGFYGDYIIYTLDENGRPGIGTSFRHSPDHNSFKKITLG